jgi:hypothetical protein
VVGLMSGLLHGLWLHAYLLVNIVTLGIGCTWCGYAGVLGSYTVGICWCCPWWWDVR